MSIQFEFYRPALVVAFACCLVPAVSMYAQEDGTASSAASVPQTVPAAQAPAQSSALPARISLVEGQVRLTQLMVGAPTGSAGTGLETQANTAQNTPQNTPPNTPLNTPGHVPPPPEDEVFKQALVNMPVMAGMQVETGEDGRVELQFSDGNVVRLTPNSAIAILSVQNGGEQLRAVRGLSYAELPEQAQGVMNVQAGPDQVRVTQNSLVRFDLDTAPFQIAVVRGSAHFNNAASDVGFEVPMGQTAKIDPVAPTAYDVHQDVASNSWDSWNMDRDNTLAELGSSETNARVGSGDSSAEAWNDLDYYGTWYDVPGTGMAWAPDGVDAGFDPYGQGAWGYYSGVGYTWVSAYPWGWLPYRCGGWSYFNGFGWLWQPGGCGGLTGAGWYPYTGIHHAPHDYRLPPRPFDPRLRTRLTGTPLPRSQPLGPSRQATGQSASFASSPNLLTPVARGTNFRFREVGGARPEPRAMPVGKAESSNSAPVYASTLPVFTMQPGQQFRQLPGAGFVGGGGGGGGGVQAGVRKNGGAPGFVSLPGQRVQGGPARAITPPPGIVAPPRNNTIVAPPRMVSTPPRMVSPPPVMRSAPAPAAAPRSH